jgi:hypothetical protein
MLVICLIIAAVLVLAVVGRFAEGSPPDNSTVHHQQDVPREEDDPGLIAEAA